MNYRYMPDLDRSERMRVSFEHERSQEPKRVDRRDVRPGPMGRPVLLVLLASLVLCAAFVVLATLIAGFGDIADEQGVADPRAVNEAPEPPSRFENTAPPVIPPAQ